MSTILTLTDFPSYKGFDRSLNISLFEYGFIYSYEDSRSNGDLRVVYQIRGNQYGWADFNKDLDFWEEFNWINPSSCNYFLEFLGTTLENFNTWSLEHKINYAIQYFGCVNICGEDYSPMIIMEVE